MKLDKDDVEIISDIVDGNVQKRLEPVVQKIDALSKDHDRLATALQDLERTVTQQGEAFAAFAGSLERRMARLLGDSP